LLALRIWVSKGAYAGLTKVFKLQTITIK